MGSSYGDFVKYPRTPHLFGSKGRTTTNISTRKTRGAFLAGPSVADCRGKDRRDECRHSLPTGRADGSPMPRPCHHPNECTRSTISSSSGPPLKRPALEERLESNSFCSGKDVRTALGPLPATSTLLFRVRRVRQGQTSLLELDKRVALLKGPAFTPFQ